MYGLSLSFLPFNLLTTCLNLPCFGLCCLISTDVKIYKKNIENQGKETLSEYTGFKCSTGMASLTIFPH